MLVFELVLAAEQGWATTKERQSIFMFHAHRFSPRRLAHPLLCFRSKISWLCKCCACLRQCGYTWMANEKELAKKVVGR